MLCIVLQYPLGIKEKLILETIRNSSLIIVSISALQLEMVVIANMFSLIQLVIEWVGYMHVEFLRQL